MQALDPAALETLVTGSGWTALALVALFVAGLAWTGLVRVWQLLFVAGSLPVRGRHCLVTGGSRGLGKALAMELARRGANVTIVARNARDLANAADEIRAVVSDGESAPSNSDSKKRQQQPPFIHWLSADVTDAEQARAVVEQATRDADGQAPAFVFLAAGASKPGMFLEQSGADLEWSLRLNVVGVANVARPAAQQMIKHGERDCRIVMVSSVLGFFGLVGYSTYVPTKFALRGLAEVLRQELKPYGIRTHIMFPGTIFTPGYEEENKTKPDITKQIEGADEGQTPESIANALLWGMERDHFFITSDFIGDLARCVGQGISPRNYPVTDAILCVIGWLAFPVWRMHADRLTKGALGASSSNQSDAINATVTNITSTSSTPMPMSDVTAGGVVADPPTSSNTAKRRSARSRSPATRSSQ